MNEDMERKLEQLLNDYPHPDYPLDEWLSEDKTEEFDRIVRERKRHKLVGRWVAVAACLLVAIGIGITMLFKEQPVPVEPNIIVKTHPTPPIIPVEQPIVDAQPMVVKAKAVVRKPKPKTTQKHMEVAQEKTEVIQETNIEKVETPIAVEIPNTNSIFSEDPFSPSIHFARDIRSRGERLEQRIRQTLDMTMY